MMTRSMGVAVVVVTMGLAAGCSSAQKKADAATVDTTVRVPVAKTAQKAPAATPDRDRGQAFGGKTIYFDFDSSLLASDATSKLGEVHGYLEEHPEATLNIEGHADERGTTEYNLALGERRAHSTKEYLRRRGVTDSRMRVISYGEERPAVQGEGEEAWSQNRRAELSANR